MNLTPKQRANVRNLLGGIADRVTFKKDGTIEARRCYYYRHGNTGESFGASVKAALRITGAVECGDHWAQWPRDSYFWARVRATDIYPEAAP